MTVDEEPDDFCWLEDTTSVEVEAWTAAQDAAFHVASEGWHARAVIERQLIQLSAQLGELSAPRPAGTRLFATRLDAGSDHPKLIVIEGGRPPRVLLDPLVLDHTGDTTIERWDPSPDGRRVVYQLSSGGTESAVLFVLDVEDGVLVDGPIDRVRRTSVGWLADGSGFYYVRRLNDHEGTYHRRVYLHRIGTDPATDSLIFGEGREKTQFYTVQTSPDGRWLVVTATAGVSPRRDSWIADLTASDPDRPLLVPVQLGVQARSTMLVPAGTGPNDRCYLRTNLDAPRGRIVACTPADPAIAQWTELISQDPEAILEDFVILDGPGLATPLVVVALARHAVGELRVHDLRDGSLITTLELPSNSTIGPLRAAPAQAHEVYFVVTGFTMPGEIFRFDGRTGVVERWHFPDHAAVEASGAQSEIVTEQLAFRSADGTTVHMFVLGKAGATGARPTLLTGYGGFGVSSNPTYLPEAIAWVLAGGVYAVANVRGGGENGSEWHRSGSGENKQNSFADFEAAADHLFDLGYTTPSQLGIYGSSNGGLLVGAALTRRPESYAAVACIAPLLDMLGYQRSGMGPSWVAEYGDVAVPEQRELLRAYSPYHQVRRDQAYPAVLFAVFDADSRVAPWHARKMCAALQRATAGATPVLYRLERGSGHGSRSMSRRTALVADLLAFFDEHLGLWA